MGVAETCWDKEKEWTIIGKLQESEWGDKYIVYASGGDKKRKGVGMIVREEVAKICNDAWADLGQNYGNEIKGEAGECVGGAGIHALWCGRIDGEKAEEWRWKG